MLLLQRGRDKILVDAGAGTIPLLDNAGGHLLEELAQLCVRPHDITHVLLTHAHWDHIGAMFVDGTEPTDRTFKYAKVSAAAWQRPRFAWLYGHACEDAQHVCVCAQFKAVFQKHTVCCSAIPSAHAPWQSPQVLLSLPTSLAYTLGRPFCHKVCQSKMR